MAKTATQTLTVKKKADQYNDPKHNYLHYWDGREYEHQAEEIAIHRLLHGKHFKTAVDVGGGYGRLCVQLETYADSVTLAEPSQQQLDIAKQFLKGHPEIQRKLMQADDLQFDDGSIELLTMIRVMHHLPDPSAEFAEIARVLSPNGLAIIEVANYLHMRNRLRHLAKRQKMPVKPVDIRSAANRTDSEIPFVNHNPYTVIRQLEHAGLHVEATLSVSNLRSVRLKKLLPRELMLGAERALQRPLATVYFGPSIFMLVRKSHSQERLGGYAPPISYTGYYDTGDKHHRLLGIGAALAAKFAVLGIRNVGDLVDNFPRRYDDYSALSPIKQLRPGVVTVEAVIKHVASYVRRGMHITEAIASDDTGSVRLVWFNQPYRAAALKADQTYYISGVYELSRQRFAILNPSIELASKFRQYGADRANLS